MPSIKFVTQQGLPILRMLQLEEAMLRTNTHNWCFYNDGTSITSIVMGISGKAEKLVHGAAAKAAGVEVIKRFTGGGTVVTDTNTQFVTLIVNQADLPSVAAQPRPIMQWTQQFYSPLFSRFGNFELQEQDYCYGASKFGGNAEAITKNRWLHHTSFLWDFKADNMGLLQMPAKTPPYREGRQHLDFICKLRNRLPMRQSIHDFLTPALEKAGFDIQDSSISEVEDLLGVDHLSTTKTVPLE